MTLLIVEDEDIIRRGFIVTVKKLDLKFDLILEAGDGEEGLRLFESHLPDIVITDIRMPLMDGLAFIERAKALSSKSKFIVLSGYSDFEYARTALKYQVQDYLLKPSSKAEIQQVLSRVMEEIKRKEEESRAIEERLSCYALQLNQFNRLLLGDILLGRYSEKEIEALLLRHSIHLSEKGFFVLCFQIFAGFLSEASDVDYKRHSEHIGSILTQSFELGPVDILTPHRCFIVGLKESSKTVPLEMKRIAEEIEEYQKQEDIKIYLSFSQTGKMVENLPKLYEEALGLLFWRFFFPDRALFAPSMSRNTFARLTVPGAMLEALYHCFVGNSRFELRQSFFSLMSYISTSPNVSPESFAQAIEQISGYLTIALIKENHMPDPPVKLELDIRKGFLFCLDLNEIYDFLISGLMQYRNTVLGKTDTSPIEYVSSPIDQAIAYIDQNYFKELDLTMLSRLVSMNSSYFSSQFKKKTGLSFSTYLQNVRLEKAKNLLLHSNQKLYEISGAIGIENVKYFCRLFKNYTGLTPTEYKNQFYNPKKVPDNLT